MVGGAFNSIYYFLIKIVFRKVKNRIWHFFGKYN
jgi:hypothetical protein